MEFKQLESFVEIVKCNSFTKAAEKLYISQPTISNHIQQLEDELNTRLVIRTTKHMEITLKGRELFEYAVNILNLKDRMVYACSATNDNIIHIGASTVPSAYILPELLSKYGQKHREIYFDITQSDSNGIIKGLKDGIYDIAFASTKGDDSDISFVPFCKEKMVIITPVNEHFLKLKKNDSLSIYELFKEPIILREKGPKKKNADRFIESIGVAESKLDVVARVNDQEAVKNLVEGGLGISFISEKAAANMVREKRILQFDLSNEFSTRELYILYSSNTIMKSYVKSFMKFVVDSYN